jgi:hypothetical protein
MKLTASGSQLKCTKLEADSFIVEAVSFKLWGPKLCATSGELSDARSSQASPAAIS